MPHLTPLIFEPCRPDFGALLLVDRILRCRRPESRNRAAANRSAQNSQAFASGK